MDHSWIVVVAMAFSPVLVGASVWIAMSMYFAAADRRRAAPDDQWVGAEPDHLGSTVAVVGPRRSVSVLWAAFVASVLAVIVAPMSGVAGIGLGILVLVAKGLVVHHGAVEPPIRIDAAALDRELRSFFDEGA